MFLFTGGFSKLELNTRQYRQDVTRAVEEVVKEGMREFLREVITHVPVYTGAAIATLKPLARFLDVSISFHASPEAAKKHPNAVVDESLGSFEEHHDGVRYSISVREELFHYLVNEFYDPFEFTYNPEESAIQRKLTHPVPWQSFRAGRLVFLAYVKKHLRRRVPKISLYRTDTRVEIE